MEAALGVLDWLVLNDEMWAPMTPCIIGDERARGSSGCDNRVFVEGVFWIARTDLRWRDLPGEVG